MNQENPYAAPTIDPIPPQPDFHPSNLASLGERFVGAFIDGLVAIGTMLPIWGAFYLLGFHRSFADIDSNAGWAASAITELLHFIIYTAVQWIPLQATGQTIGKRVANTRIATMDGGKPPMVDLILKRHAVFWGLALIPKGGSIVSLIDVLMIFKRDRRCLHDLVAGTQVLRVRNIP